MNPWDLTRERADLYEEWKYEVANGHTLRSFAEYVAARFERDETVRNTPEGWNS